MTGTPTYLLVLAKEPVAGRVKTRLSPTYTPAQAATLARAALEDTLAAALATRGTRVLLVLDGNPGPWLPASVHVADQVAGTLDERIGGAFDLVAGNSALLIGMDTPQVTPSLLARAARATREGAAFGPARDGGWWALGLAQADGALVRGIETSTARTGSWQRERLRAAGLTVHDLPTVEDVDTPGDAAHVAALAPKGRFAATWRRLQENHVQDSRFQAEESGT
jgi:glycosyltransferase A (GT-A) superfamily protein (DUF2064 family)